MLAAPAPSVRNGFWRLVAFTTLVALAAYPVFGSLLNRVIRDAPTRLPLRAYTSLPSAKEFVADDARFRAMFPDQPERETQQIRRLGGATELTVYTAGNEITRFAVGASELPSGQRPDLYASMNAAVDTVDGHLESSAPVTFAGSPAIEFRFRSGDAFGRGLVVHSTDREYLLFVLSRHRDEAVDYEEFKRSFVINP